MGRVATRLPDLGTPPEIWVTYPSGLTWQEMGVRHNIVRDEKNREAAPETA